KVLRRMNFTAEKDVAKTDTAAPAASATPAEHAVEVATPEPADKRKTNLRPLASLLPYVNRYRGRALAALAALVVAALTTLIVPIAVRRMIDFGFTERGVELIDSYFLVMIGAAGLLALANATRHLLFNTVGG